MGGEFDGASTINHGYNPGVRRRLFNFAAAVSLLLCLATVVLWVRSYWRLDDVSLRWHSDYFGITSTDGTLGLYLARSWPIGDHFAWVCTEPDPVIILGHQCAGFGFGLRDQPAA